MNSVWFYTLLSVILVSLVSLIGIFTLSIKIERLKKILIYLISFSAGALLGDVFIHLLPEIVEENGFEISTSLGVLGGIAIFFVVEKIIHWRHCHMPIDNKEHVHAFAYTNLIGDGVHNFLDGIIIASAYLVNIPAGIATTFAVILHEIPQEIGDFGVLIHGGFSKVRALLMNFISSLLAVLGAVLTLLIGSRVEGIIPILVSLAAGGFIYVAGSDLIPELHKETGVKKSILQLVAFLLGIVVMACLLLLE
jgi:zinc and cadmium transporter